jgi:hypothetical protein
MCSAWLCHTRIFSFGVELLIFSILMGFGGIVNALVCRIWGEADEALQQSTGV